MPLILILFGIIFIDLAWQGNEAKFFELVKTSLFSGQKVGYFEWATAIFVVSLLGYSKELRPIAIGLIALVFIVMLDANGNLKNLINQVKNLKE